MAKKPLQKLSPKLEEELHVKLEELLDTYDEVKDKRRRLGKLLGGHLKVIGGSIDLARRQLKGIDLDQLEIPGTGTPAPAQDPLVADILRIAGGIVDRKEEDEDGDDVPAADEEPGRLPPMPPPLRWMKNQFGLLQADVPGGFYVFEDHPGGWFNAIWQTSTGKRTKLDTNATEEHAKAACARHHLELFADAALKNAGAGDLTKGELKGPAQAFKKGGRRG
jgi:hypothetical protein